ncbi:hypothetical protein I302_105423 [Kwoniella bestiolae CBS 10118]|uniref:Uncharacterized protein n=1 Tax=Kwoniella bestiolae CBS 10118 TaxID=1296100 RepID=A0A1B9FT29_9TREE|nr:hypothetical protein I302_08704 [Kwoniella bestiolae CBS 10118]OCF21925.1 hypothetical protein I302_08704 [Kwoniella bestiolae CBS 10118]
MPSSQSQDLEVENLSYVDIQHDALAVFDDIEQGVVLSEDIWISGYKAGESSVHGKAKVTVREGGGAELVGREGVKIERLGKTNFNVSIPKLSISNRSVKFPKQIIHPPYKKSSNLDAPLHINSLSLNPKTPHVVVGGPDGYCAILPMSLNSSEKEVYLRGHVGDVRDVRWFPSGEVILTASSDLSIRIYGRDGINPRTLRGHTRAITSIHILGLGRQVISASKDGTIRLWDVSKGEEVKRWLVGLESRMTIEGMLLIDQPSSINTLGLEEERVMLLNVQDGVWVQPFSSDDRGDGWFIRNDFGSQLISIDERDGVVVLGYMSGVVEIMDLGRLRKPSSSIDPALYEGKEGRVDRIKRIRRNESPIYSLHLAPSGDRDQLDLYVGTSSGLPCLLNIRVREDRFEVEIKDELAGWEASGVECWGKVGENVWCAGGEGGLRRY